MNAPTLIILLLIIAFVIKVFADSFRKKTKAGGCGGSCGSCPHADHCHH